jgi:hypothetical protein
MQMNELISQCLSLIIHDDVDQALQAFEEVYAWIAKNRFTDRNFQGIPNRFLDRISQTLTKKEHKRQIITAEEMDSLSFRNHKAITDVITGSFLQKLTGEESMDFLGELVGAYALVVPEPLFRAAKTFSGLHQTADIPPIDDDLPMTDEMILFGWQYHWFYTALGH